ncbi:glycosyltransferase family 8 protein [Terasakiella pusilla]|uniref:glycosyltransferase family 8 protein n=1 Tax=Terasakiella pusilla TaxID=64973 RepID=UPI00048E8E94|nr:glycosyltransferase [Terasakiella pusilla]
MNSSVSKNYCLATVTTKSFIMGTAVLIDSFLEHNVWFDGDIIVIADIQELEQQEIDILSGFKRVKLVDVSSELRGNVRDLESVNSSLIGKAARFFSLESFNLRGYEKVLFCDSDMLFVGTVEPLFKSERPLLCCGDGVYYQGKNRNKRSFSPCAPKVPSEEISNTFNAGFMLIDESLITRTIFQSLVDMTTHAYWEDETILHTDQRILNLFFAGQQTIIPAVYNYLLTHQNSINAADPTVLENIKVFHFNGPAKPWLLERSMGAVNDNSLQLRAYIRWHQQYAKLLTKKHLESIAKNFSPN